MVDVETLLQQAYPHAGKSDLTYTFGTLHCRTEIHEALTHGKN